MRELKREDPSELELGLELELESEDVDAAVAAVAEASEGQIPCSCCDQLLETTDQLHSHQIEHHSLMELSLALITLRGLDLSLVNGAFEMKETNCSDEDTHLRNILLKSADRSHDCDSESTVTVSSEMRMAMMSPPSSPFFCALEENTDFYPWREVVTYPSYSPNSIKKEPQCNDNQVHENSNDSGFWSDNRVMNIETPVTDPKNSMKHNDWDSRQFSCHLCDRRYKKKSHLERHQRVHTGIRPYACPMCDKRFAVQSILKQHIRVHTGERPFSCNICFQRFPQKSGLMTHMMLHNGKPFKCEYCVKSFVSNHKLMLHQRSHGDLLNGAPNQGPYCCTTCDTRFFTTGALSEHAKIHTHQAHQSSSKRNRNGVTITEQAAKEAVAAVGNTSISPDYHYDFIQYKDEQLEYQSDTPVFQDEFLEVIKVELQEDVSLSESFHCEARWSGIDDMYVGPDFSNVC